jgi:hypothetical protein
MVEAERRSMLDVDVAVPRSADGRGRAPGGAGWLEERRPLLIAGAFAVAVLLGVLIGLVTAPDGRRSSTPRAAAGAAPAEQSPPLGPSPWEGHRQPGQAHQMTVDRGGVLRRALQSSFASWMRAQSGASRPTADDVSIPTRQLYYGAVEGAAAAQDEYWAAGSTVVRGTSQPPANPQVWRRVGAGPWTLVRSGPGACGALPQGLFGPGVWQARPALCTTA